MKSINISLPEPLKQFVDGQKTTGHYGSASAYVRELIRAGAKRKAKEELETKLLEGLNSPESELTQARLDGHPQRGPGARTGVSHCLALMPDA